MVPRPVVPVEGSSPAEAEPVATIQAEPAEVETTYPSEADIPKVARCRRCEHELYVGNSFCTECGLRIE